MLKRKNYIGSKEYYEEFQKSSATVGQEMTNLRKAVEDQTEYLAQSNPVISVLAAVLLAVGFGFGLYYSYKIMPLALWVVCVVTAAAMTGFAVADCIFIVRRFAQKNSLRDRIDSIEQSFKDGNSSCNKIFTDMDSYDIPIIPNEPLFVKMRELREDVSRLSGRARAWEIILSVVYFITVLVASVAVSVAMTQVVENSPYQSFIRVIMTISLYITPLADIALCIYVWIKAGNRTSSAVLLTILGFPLCYFAVEIALPIAAVAFTCWIVYLFIRWLINSNQCSYGENFCDGNHTIGGCCHCCCMCCELC